jgi:thioredoxin reductase
VRHERSVDVLVVGGGPAGLTTATELARLGVGRVEVVDRGSELGGIPLFCEHTGFGLRDLRRSLSGPAYAARLVDRAAAAGVDLRPGVCVTGWDGGALLTTSPDGLARVEAGAVVLATGARERPRPARWIPGDRPAGVLTTGQLQRSVRHGLTVGSSAVVVGAEHVSFSAVLTLRHAGARVVAMTTERGRHQSYAAFRFAAAARYRFPVLTGTRVVRVVGRDRVQGVDVVGPDGAGRRLECDVVVLTGDWVGEHELARAAGVGLDPSRTAPLVDTLLRTALPGLVCAGNLVHAVLTADAAALDASVAAASALAALRTGSALGPGAAPGPFPTAPLVAGVGLSRVAPGLVALAEPPRGRVVVWPDLARRRPELEVRQGGRLLWRGRAVRPLVPDRPYDLPAGWVHDVQAPGPEVVVSVSP